MTRCHRIHRLGSRAADSLARSGGWIVPLDEFPESPYAEAAGEIVWLGRAARTEHPRMIVSELPVPLSGRARLEYAGANLWQPPRRAAGAVSLRPHLAQVCERLRNGRSAAVPLGFATLLAGVTPPFPLALGCERVRRLARAYADGATGEIVAASCELLGFGSGLTPSGDDVVGGALFGARLTAGEPGPAGGSFTTGQIGAIAASVLDAATRRTHRLSAALLEDLAAGATYGVLHRFIECLDAPLFENEIDEPLGRLGSIGHSSGWDVFTGLVIGALRAPHLLSG